MTPNRPRLAFANGIDYDIDQRHRAGWIAAATEAAHPDSRDGWEK